MSESEPVCTACGAKGSLELELASGTLACNQCGVVASNSMNEAFEFLGRVDEEDEYTNGRMYVSDKNTAWGGGLAASGIRAMGGRAGQWAAGVGEKSTMFHAKKRSEAEKFIKRLLHRFDAMSRKNKVITLFSGMKEKMGFTWGYRAEVYAAACVYVAIREDHREIWVQDVLNACDDMMTATIQALHFARAVRITKLENEIRTAEIDPVMFVERILVHLQQILRDPKPKYHVGAKEKAFLAKNLTWIRGLSLQDARTLAVSLLGFSRELYLVAGRSPEQVACAVVMVALEGIARQPCPKQQEFDDELAWLTKTASFTIQERYREYIKALTDYAPKLPWVASKASKWKKKEVVEYTSDIVQFWRALDAKQKKDKAKKVEEELQAKKAEEELQATRMKEDLQDDGRRKWDGKIEGEESTSDAGRDQRQESEQIPEEGQEQLHQFEEAEEEEYEGSDEEALPANLQDDYDDNRTDPPTPSETDFMDPMISKPNADLYEFDQNDRAPSKRGGGGGLDKTVRAESVAKRAQEYVRGSPEWTRRRAAEAALAKGYRPSPSPALSPAPPTPETYFPDLCSPTPPLPPIASSSKSSSKLNPNYNRPLTAIESNEILAYGHKPEAIRAQLAPGHSGTKRDHGLNRSETRLSRLLWEKTAQDIEDEELFADGELESYLRTDEEAAYVSRTENFSKMIKDANSQKHLEREIRPRRRVGGQINPEFTELKGEAESKGVSMETVLRRRSRKARGESDEEDVSREFRPRKKKSRVGDEARKRLAAFLAKNGSDEEEPEEGGQEWVGLAINVAGNVDSGVQDVDGVDDEDEQELEDDHAGGTDWKKEVQYASNDGFDYDEED